MVVLGHGGREVVLLAGGLGRLLLVLAGGGGRGGLPRVSPVRCAVCGGAELARTATAAVGVGRGVGRRLIGLGLALCAVRLAAGSLAERPEERPAVVAVVGERAGAEGGDQRNGQDQDQ